MKSALVTNFCPNFGEITDDVLTFTSTQEKPTLEKNNKKNPGMIVKVFACSIAAGDSIVLSGNIVFLKPALPYVPGMDICGIVEEISEGVENFKVGDIVAANNGMNCTNGMAEYMLVDPNLAKLKPKSVDVLQAAACNSAVTSYNATEYVKENDRVLILGGSGGVGSSTITLAKKLRKASYVAATSTQKEMCTKLGADEVINYNEKNWWEMKHFEDKFDVIIDCVGGGNFYDKATNVLKTGEEGGYFIAVTGDEPRVDASSWTKAIKFFANLPLRYVYTWWYYNCYPRYITLLPYDEIIGLEKVLKLIEDGELEIVLDGSSPHEFTKEGVQEAFKIQGKGHAHGKVVVKIADA